MDNSLKSAKQSLRQIFYQKRKTIQSKSLKSEIIIQKLKQLEDFKECRSILLYYSTPDEVDTHALISECIAKGKTVYLPSTKEILITKITSTTSLKEHIENILEPEHPDIELPSSVDIVLLPGLAFDRKGYRLGMGNGWYDRLLETLVIKTRIGLIFDDLLVESLPSEKHDKKIDCILTERNEIILG